LINIGLHIFDFLRSIKVKVVVGCISEALQGSEMASHLH
jgi:hypothetical protein